jgi:hypothetical protein
MSLHRLSEIQRLGVRHGVGVPASALKITGTLKTFTKPGSSGNPIHRRFCAECGSGIVDEADAMPGTVRFSQ